MSVVPISSSFNKLNGFMVGKVASCELRIVSENKKPETKEGEKKKKVNTIYNILNEHW